MFSYKGIFESDFLLALCLRERHAFHFLLSEEHWKTSNIISLHFVLPSATDCHIAQVKKHVISLFILSVFGVLWREIIYLSFSGIDLICLVSRLA